MSTPAARYLHNLRVARKLYRAYRREFPTPQPCWATLASDAQAGWIAVAGMFGSV